MNFFRKKTSLEASTPDASSVSTASSKTQLNYIKCHLPIDQPLNPIKPPLFDLTEEQQQKYDELHEHMKVFILKPVPVSDKKGAPTHPVLEEEKAWLTKECYLRYLRASKWKLDVAIKRLEESFVWRRTFGVVNIPGHTETLITADLVVDENATGKHYIVGYDIDNRPCLYLRNGYQNTPPSIRQVQFLVFMLERVIQFMPPGQDTLALLIDFKGAPEHMKLAPPSVPPIGVTKHVLHILQYHYPERLGRGLFNNIPWIGYAFLKLAGPFIDPYTRLKTIYDQPFENFVPKDHLNKDFNGNLDFDYIHEVYWDEMNAMAEEKQENYLRNFRKFGGEIGLSEYDLRLPFESDQTEQTAEA